MPTTNPEWEVVVNEAHLIMGCLDEPHALKQLEYTRTVLGYSKAYINKHYPDHDERYEEPPKSR